MVRNARINRPVTFSLVVAEASFLNKQVGLNKMFSRTSALRHSVDHRRNAEGLNENFRDSETNPVEHRNGGECHPCSFRKSSCDTQESFHPFKVLI